MSKQPRRLTAEALAKCPTGIRGLDQITDGGLPRGRSTLVCADLEDRVMIGLDIVPKSRNGRG